MKMTLAQARAHFGFADDITDEIVRQAAAGASIEIVAQLDDADGDADDQPITQRLADLTEAMRSLGESIRTSGGDGNDEQRAEMEALRATVSDLHKAIKDAGARTPSMRKEGARTATRPWWEDVDDWSRADYELAMTLFEQTQQISRGPGLRERVTPSEQFIRAYNERVFDDPDSPPPSYTDGNGNVVRQFEPWPTSPNEWHARAADTAESGNGLEFIGAQYVRELWTAARQADALVQRIRTIPLTDATATLPTDGALPEMLFVGESTADDATAYGVSSAPTANRTLTAKKFTIQQLWSGELNEDSIIAYVPFLRQLLNESAAQHLGSAMYNGDTTNAGTGNINSDDADPADTKHYLAWDGIRHYVLVDATGQGKSMAGALDPKELWRARGKLAINSADDVDAAVGNINWGLNARELLLIADFDTFMEMHDIEGVRTVDEYGAAATVVTGELGSVNGIPIISPGYASRTEADGKASGTAANNVKGQIMITNPRAWVRGQRRDTQVFFDRVQRTDQFLLELYTRQSFNRFGGNVAAGIYNIDLAA